MATYVLGQYECRQYFDDNGDPLAGGFVSTYLSGTSTPAPTYADAIGTPNPWPLVLDSAGRAILYLDTTLTYKFVVTDAAGVTIATIDPINPLPTVTPGVIFAVNPGSAAFPGFTFTGDENTGLYGPGADILAVTTGGVERARWGPTGGMNVGGTTDPGDDNLRVEGTLTVQGASTLAGALTVGGVATLSGGVSGSLAITGATVDTLGVTSLATIATLNVTGTTTCSGPLDAGDVIVCTGGLLRLANTVSGTVQAFNGVYKPLNLDASSLAVLTSSTLRLTLHPSGGLSLGDAVDPGTGSLRVTGGAAVGTTLAVAGNSTLTGTLTVGGGTVLNGSLGVVNAVSIGTTLTVTGAAAVQTLRVAGAAVTDQGGTPTLSGGFAAGTTIAGRDYAFLITIGPTASLAGSVTFATPYATPPVCVASHDQAAAGACLTSATTTQVVVAPSSGPWPAGTKISVLCRGK